MFMVIGKIKEENDFHGPFSEMNELWFGVRNRRWFHGLFLMSKLQENDYLQLAQNGKISHVRVI